MRVLPFLLAACASAQTLPQGTVQSAYDLLERMLPGSSSHFALSFVPTCPGATSPHCFTMADAAGGRVAIAGTSASELTAALGIYFRERCNMTIGWTRGGGSYVYTPSPWPAVGAPLTISRAVPYNYIMNVCTHSYSLWTYTWQEWEGFSALRRDARGVRASLPPSTRTRAHARPALQLTGWRCLALTSSWP